AAAPPAAPAAAAPATQPSAEQVAFFEHKIRPVLVESCYQCHSAQAKENNKLKGGLYLDTREGLLKGGDTGPAIVPGQSAKSLLMKAIRWEDSGLEMPPKKRLSDAVVADFATWIDAGAADPRGGAVAAAKTIDIAKGREHWAYRPLAAGAPPAVTDAAWPRTDVDRFVLARLEAAGLKPSGPVSREALVRRAYFDLTGLPPTPAEVDAFLADTSATAFESLVDRLLASPRYGERWGRHWLDVVRFAESGGYEFDAFRPGAYHYRDWVIRAVNDDLPYDRFVRMQIAGDKLAPGTLDGAAATGFLVAGPYPGQITAKTRERIRYDQLDDMVATAGEALLGTTLKCVRCHDHKYDPIPQADYYGLAAALARTEHGEIKIDLASAETEKKQAAFEATLKPMREALAAYTKDELPKRLEAWKAEKLAAAAAGGEPVTAWQTFDLLSASAGTAQLSLGVGGVVRYESNKAKDDTYTLRAVTYQTGLTQIRLDALADKASPAGGPGLSDNGNFVLGDIKVIAKPLDPASKAKPVMPKLTAVAATFEQKNYPLSAAVDNSPTSGWAVHPKLGVDHAAIFGFEGEPVGFPGGTEIEIQLKFARFYGLGKATVSFDNAAKPLALTSPVEPQNRRELVAVLTTAGATTTPADAKAAKPAAEKAAAAKQATAAKPAGKAKGAKAAAPATPPVDEADKLHLLRWFAAVDPRAGELMRAVQEQERKRPRPELIGVYSTKAGGDDVYLLKRGEVDNKAGKAALGYVQVLSKAEPTHWAAPAAQGKPATDPRVALANWATDDQAGAGHLLARVIVNRVWKYHFGQGLVRTPNDFGLQGERPTHPELLDFLASELVRNGWKLKPLHRLIMRSAVYQQGMDASPVALERDPENKLWWHRPSRRLEAEAVRDALLVVGGRLDERMFGPSETAVETPRRSVYLRVKRSELIPFLTLFDGPEPAQSVGDRGVTTVPTQALTLLNSPF
ncbi:MAG TPA: PSD1 and planctomycete cytochrome C domain-containing protein, partial [Humisphaera sp.]